MTLAEFAAKRKRIWENLHDGDYDRNTVVPVAVKDILDNKELRTEVIKRPWLLIEIAFSVVDKSKRTVPFFLNEVQRDFIERLEATDGRPFFILKGRQQGFTTLITAIQLACSIVKHNFSGFTVADCNDNTTTIFNDKAKAVYALLPPILRPQEKYNNRKEFYFDKLNSSWRIATASNEIGRSKTLEFCHFSEVAFYECPLSKLQASIGEAIIQNTIVVYETTANGYNEAKELWDSGSCQNLFYEWWRTSEYERDDLTVLDDLRDAWIRERVKWLREKGIAERKIAWYVNKYNGYLDKSTIRQEYPCSPEEAFISSGECEFGNDSVMAQINRVRGLQPAKRGYFEYRKSRPKEGGFDEIEISGISWVDDPNGEIIIHTEPVVDEKNGKKPYAIGGDTAGDGSDFFTAKVIDNITGRTVATYRRKNVSDDQYAEQLYCLGMYYNEAIVGVEVNFSAAATKRLEQCNYPRLYVRERFDAIVNKVDLRHGFKTTAQSRPVIIAELKRKWRESDGTIEVDVDTLKEMLSFVKDDKGKPQALSGQHDDLVMALAIAHHVGAEQGDHTWQDKPVEKDFIEETFGAFKREDEGDSGYGSYISWE